MAPQLEHFGHERRAVAFDYPGYGDSDPAPEGTTRDDYAAAILVRDDRARHRPRARLRTVARRSRGDRHASRRPERMRLADPRRHVRRAPDGQAIYERSLAGSEDMRALAEARVDVLLAQPADPAVRSEVVETMARIDPAAYRIGAEAVWLADQRERAAAIRVPTLVLCGAEDRVTPPALSNALTRLIPGAQYEAIERAGHSPISNARTSSTRSSAPSSAAWIRGREYQLDQVRKFPTGLDSFVSYVDGEIIECATLV